MIATPWYDSRGPRVSYDRVFRALQEAGVYEEEPIQRIFLKSPNDPLVKTLEREIEMRTEGTIHLVRSRRLREMITW